MFPAAAPAAAAALYRKERWDDYLLSPKRISQKIIIRNSQLYFLKRILFFFGEKCFREKLQLAMSLPASSKCSLGWKFEN